MHRPHADVAAGPTRRALRRTLTAIVVAALMTGTASAASADDARNTAAAVTSVASGSLTVNVTGQDYNAGLPLASSGLPAAGVYAALVNRTSASTEITMGSGSYAANFVPNAALAGGLSTNLVATAETLPADAEFDVVLWSAHGNPTATSVVARVEVALTETQRAELFSAVPTIAGVALPGETLTATVGGKWGEVFDLDYQWFANGVVIADATALTYVVTPAELGKAITFAATATPAEGDAFTATSEPTAKVARPTTTSATVTSTGLSVAVSGQHYNVGLPNASSGSPAAGVYVALIPSTTDSATVTAGSGHLAATFVPKAALNAGLAATLNAAASALDASADYDVLVWTAHGNPTADTIVARVGVELSPAQRVAMVAKPTISGTTQVGRTLTASAGQWGVLETVAFQWYANGVAIDGATNATFVPTAAQLDTTLTVTATSAGEGSITRTSAATATVTRKTSVVVSSTASGLTLLVSGQGYTGLPNSSTNQPAAGVYAAIIAEGTDLSTITAGAGHIGVSYVGAASIVDGDVVTSVSTTPAKLDPAKNYEIIMWVAHGFPNASTVVNRIPVNLTAAQRSAMIATTPVIQGVTQVGSTLTAATDTWGDDAALTYQWKADGVAITDATSATYEPTADVIGKQISVTVTGTPTGGPATVRNSAATGAVLGLLNVGSATVTGTVQVGQAVVAHVGTWEDGTTLAYQWLSDGEAISGATDASYSVPASLNGKSLSVVVTGKRAGFATVVTKSAATVVKAGVFAKAPAPTISGTVQVGKTLTAKPGTWDTGVALKYQWYANGSAISGATKTTYVVSASQYGKKLTVKVTGSKSGYTTTAKTSSATAAVKAATLVKQPTPTISGTAKVGSTLTAKPGTWDSGVSLTYQWYASGKTISGATKATYKVSSTYKGKTITVKVTAKKTGYTTVAKTSKATSTVK